MDTLTGGKLIITEVKSTARTKMKRFSKHYGVFNRHSDALAICLCGECEYDFDHGDRFTVRQGDILYLAKGDSYFMKVTSDLYDVIFTDFVFDGNEDERHSRVFSLPTAASLESTFTTLHDLSGSDDIPTQMSLLYSVYARICAKEKEKEGGSHNLKRSKDRIDNEYNDFRLSVSSLSDELGISEVYFRRLYAEKYGTSPSKYIRAVRISRAKELLRYSFLNVNECATQCGFTSSQYFCRAFKEVTGMTPNEYRKKKFRGT